MEEMANVIAFPTARTVALSLCLTCSACISIEKYPDTWAAPQTHVSGCPDLTGTYQTEGSVTPEPTAEEAQLGERERLDMDLFDAEGATSVIIAGPKDGAINVTALQDETILSQITLEEEKWFFWKSGHFKFMCRSGQVLVLWHDSADAFQGVALGGSSETRSYGKAVDGSLIVHTVFRSGGLTLLFPYYASHEKWAFFPPAPQHQKQSP
jgi:hypothetical protein